MRIDTVDFFYLSMPEITLDADGSQDALLVRVQADGQVGWGECEASPLTSIAAFVAPSSHGACRRLADSIIGAEMDCPTDIRRIGALVARNSMDLLQAPHTFSGIETALWDLLGRVKEEPVWSLLGFTTTLPKTPYASVLFGSKPQDTFTVARDLTRQGFQAAKFGWGPFGATSLRADIDQLHAAREGLGADRTLLVDAGQVWGDDVAAAAARLPALEEVGALWLEEPFDADALPAYESLSRRAARVGLAGGEGAHNVHMARNLITYGGIRFVQIDTGRIGGIAAAAKVREIATDAGVTYVNHTFTSHLALSASLQPFAGAPANSICEYPAAPQILATDITVNHLTRNGDGEIYAPDAPGLGMEIDLDRLRPYHRTVGIDIDDRAVFRSAPLRSPHSTAATVTR